MCQLKAPQIPQKRENAKVERGNKGSVQWIAVERGKKSISLPDTLASTGSLLIFTSRSNRWNIHLISNYGKTLLPSWLKHGLLFCSKYPQARPLTQTSKRGWPRGRICNERINLFSKLQTPQGGCCEQLSQFCLDRSPGPIKTGIFQEEMCKKRNCEGTSVFKWIKPFRSTMGFF